MSQQIAVLVVDNEPGFAGLASEMLEREHDAIAATPATSAPEALEYLEADSQPVDCIVSDYEMAELTGLELLERVRAVDPELPFILFTGRGSEAVASEAIDAGVTQYLQKQSGKEQYTLLANQITNSVAQYRAETELRESERRYERTVTTLHETTRELMRAETKAEIYESAVETAAEMRNVAAAAAYTFEPTERVLEHVAAASASTSTGESRAVVDPDIDAARSNDMIWEAFSEGSVTEYNECTQAGGILRTELVHRSEVVVPLGSHGALVAGTTDSDGFAETTTEVIQILAANTEAALDRAEREQLLREHDRTLTEQNEELTRLNHINEIVREINHGVAQASTRNEVETTVCDRLADTDRYRFAWIASTDEPPEPTTWEGVDAAYMDRIRDGGCQAPEATLVRQTLEAERPCVVRDVLETDAWDQRRAEALTYGFQRVLAVPVTDGEREFGVLLVHIGGGEDIGDAEREVLAELGETIGHAIHSIERTRAMLTDSRLELELECRDSRLLFNRLTTRIEESLTVAGVIDRNDDEFVCFVSTPSSADIRPVAEQWAALETCSVVSDGEDETLFEITGSTTPLLDVLRTYDVTVRSVTAEAGVSTLVLDVPKRVEARTLIEAITERYPETELEARRETTSTRSARQLDTYLEEELTDKQHEALQAAFYSGFFEWPRESTGEDLAAALDVSSPTYHYHLRAAERKLVTLALDSHSN
ncbi:receiver/bat box HTH-10 family transcription regulator [Natrialba magadii ATCC 43099]|uniref:Receiver/bat box HTH-10 family transcription regulator n=1 Tax=Natrialba magadii (strain ATCC 43099 / DSM 3394 / CCM 3739 / CIP 104546 / IAM 13178 / JCM 8861 / NBRC 102185 / NCIMB 2190 / MS3) TaxID=547559 RepID=D3SW55_NATMM|nr:bacterio-opsin activator domain-containing protein [Natrialba magadii]ADD05716.1 receiver/bat box HTH-10 family transcription regulator [Natrialba magadii ATCC 43099]ELY29873.1 response regulator receiver modulated GAF sensor protein [Natrialba magadii ATCC 43099]